MVKELLSLSIKLIKKYGIHDLDTRDPGYPAKIELGCRVGLTDLEKSCRCWKLKTINQLRVIINGL